MKDPIVEEVREIRLKIEQACLVAGISYKDHLLAVQERYKGRLVVHHEEGTGIKSDIDKRM